MTKRFSHISGLLMAVTMIFTCFGATTAFAAEVSPEVIAIEETGEYANITNTVMPRAGEETLPLGWYLIEQHFTVTNDNLSPVKTVSGRYMTLKFNWMVATDDQGIGGEIVTIRLVDPDTQEFLTVPITTEVADKWLLVPFEVTFDMGYAGRRIQIYTDVSSNGTSNGHYRSATFYDYQTNVYN